MLVDAHCKTPECSAPVQELLIKRKEIEEDGRIPDHKCSVCGSDLYKPEVHRTSFKLVGKWFASGGY